MSSLTSDKARCGSSSRRAQAMGMLLLVAASACGGRVGSQSVGQQGQAGHVNGGGANDTDPPDCCDPPIITCFAAGTSIATPAGPRPIEEIEVGQDVFGFDEALQAVVARPVTARMRHPDAVVGQLVLGDGRNIVTTPNHPFYVTSEGSYRPAEELQSGADLLSLFDAGRLSSATATGYFVAAAPVRMPVFNITVPDVHNYFADGVLVHNKSPLDPCEGLSSDPAGLVALTGSEHARSVLRLTGVEIEPVPNGSTYAYHGLTLPGPQAYGVSQLAPIAAAAKLASKSALGSLACSVDSSEPERCGGAFIESFVTRSYRRPPAESERSRYFELFRSAHAGSDFATAIRTVVEAALQSPHFLYKVELADGELSDYELGTRLSYFLTGEPPDAQMMSLANSALLKQSLESEVARLSASPQFSESMRELYGAWLGLDRLVVGEAAPAELVQAMRGETEAFFRWHVSSNAPIASLLTEPFTFLDARMAAHYGLPAPESGMERVELDPARNAGALTQASFMTAFPTSTRRGTWILGRLLCQEVPPPPPDVVFPPPPAPGVDHRTWLEQATAAPNCQACHQRMDAIGFAFESFDELGKWRPGNDAGAIQVGDLDVQAQGAAELASALVSSSQVQQCITSHWMAWALKRLPDERLECETEQLASNLSGPITVKELVKVIALSSVFAQGDSRAVSVDDPIVPPKPVVPLDTEAARSSAARDLVLQELEALLQKLPNEASLAAHQQALESLDPL